MVWNVDRNQRSFDKFQQYEMLVAGEYVNWTRLNIVYTNESKLWALIRSSTISLATPMLHSIYEARHVIFCIFRVFSLEIFRSK